MDAAGSPAGSLASPFPTKGADTDLHYHTRGSRAGARWQKVLFVRQPYPDNHIDETFLASLVTNANVQPYEFWPMVKATAVVIQQISVMAIFFLIFAFVHQDTVSVTTIAAMNMAVVMGIIIVFRNAGPRFSTQGLLPDALTLMKQLAIFVAVLFGLSPLLQTLTQSYCNDTIWAQTIPLSCLHIVFHEYRVTNQSSVVSGAISFNAAMFAAVLMASRLPTNMHVFVFILLAIQLFALFPLLRDFLRVRSEEVHLSVAVGLAVLTVCLLSFTNTLLVVVYASSVLFICFVCPWWLMGVQKYKNEIQGPWDIATVAQFAT